jgi:hypothetical protein
MQIETLFSDGNCSAEHLEPRTPSYSHTICAHRGGRTENFCLRVVAAIGYR